MAEKLGDLSTKVLGTLWKQAKRFYRLGLIDHEAYRNITHRIRLEVDSR
jgi:hypothetical protein